MDVAEDPENPLPPVAVKDIAYVRPNEPTMLSALANDQSPGGRVIGIQSVDIPESSNQLSVEILNSSILRITAPSGLTESPVSYTHLDVYKRQRLVSADDIPLLEGAARS